MAIVNTYDAVSSQDFPPFTGSAAIVAVVSNLRNEQASIIKFSVTTKLIPPSNSVPVVSSKKSVTSPCRARDSLFILASTLAVFFTLYS